MIQHFTSFQVPSPIAIANDDEGIRMETTTLLPGGALVVVRVLGDGSNYIVNDDASGRTTLFALGFQDLRRGDTRRGRDIAETQGLAFDGQSFSLAGVSHDQLPAAIAYVAEACRAWTNGAVEAHHKYTERDLAERTVRMLREALPNVPIEMDRSLQGISTKRHRFDIVATLPQDRFAIFEMLSSAPVSMATVHMKFHDLMQAHADWPREAVVERLDNWHSEDLAVMQQVATHVRGVAMPWNDLARLTA